jgi:HTH-type transcriptional regulator/antitoxin HipB
MATSYPLRFADQLRQHLRALRKKRGFTQARLGELVGVSQARIAEIESNPGLVGFEQMLKLFSALGITLSLQDDIPETIAEDQPRGMKRPPKNKPAPSSNAKLKFTQDTLPTGARYTFHTSAGKWETYPALTESGASEADALMQPEQRPTRDKEARPAPRHGLAIRPKKGSW